MKTISNEHSWCVNPYINVSIHPSGVIKPCCMANYSYVTDSGSGYLNQENIINFWNSKDRKKFISDLESQFLCFVIDSDKENFTDEIYKIDKNNNTFITAFRRSEEFDKLVEDNSSPNETAYSSHNGQVVHGYGFFTKFTEDEDKDGI